MAIHSLLRTTAGAPAGHGGQANDRKPFLNTAKVNTTFHAMSMLMQRAFATAARPLAVSVRPHKASVAGVAWVTFFGGATARASAVPTRAAMWRTAGACAAGARLMSMGHLAAAQKSLDSIVKLESLRKEDAASIIAIWMEYHKAKDACAAAVMSRAEYDTVLFRGKKSPVCIAPVRKGAGHVTMVSHFKEGKLFVTTLQDYQTKKELASPVLVISVHSELLQVLAIFHSFLYACMHARMYVCMYVRMHVCVCVCVCVCVYECLSACMYFPTYVCMHACMHV